MVGNRNHETPIAFWRNDGLNPHDDRRRLNLRPLPREAMIVLAQWPLPPRLAAHLIIVHHVACDLLAALERAGLAAQVDGPAVRLGAALHDIGKVRHPEELAGPGSRHEAAGQALLLAAGVAPRIARFAVSHASWADDPRPASEDLLVALADTCWKGQRDHALEQAVAERLVADRWAAWTLVDQMAEEAADRAPLYLAWQSRF